jgi:hypothetical protein
MTPLLDGQCVTLHRPLLGESIPRAWGVTRLEPANGYAGALAVEDPAAAFSVVARECAGIRRQKAPCSDRAVRTRNSAQAAR